MRRKWKIHNKIGWQIMLLILFTIILPSVFFFWFMVNRYSNDLISQAIDERVSLLQEINKSISLQFSGFRELSMTIYYDNSTRTYIDSRDYTEPPATVDEALTTILNTRPYVDSLILCFGERVYCYGRNFTNLRQYREKYETQVLEKEGKTVWLPTEIMHGSYSRKPRDFALARAINAPDGQVGVFYMFCSSDFFGKIYSNPILTEGSSHYYLLDPDGQVVMSDLTASVGSGSTLTFTADALKDQKGSLTVDGTDGNAQIASYARMDGTGWVSVIVAERSELTANARSLRRLSDVFSLFYLLVMVAGYGAIYGFIIRPLGSLSGGMEKVARGEFHELQSPPGQNEIKQLTESYNVMVVQIQTLLQQVRAEEAEKNEQRIKVLYMQIGPHFLYNTLNSIKWMAVLNNQSGIKQMVESLMKLMAAVTYNKQDNITLREELELMDSYIYIQKIRFMNFQVVYDVPEDAMELQIGRFTLQPFVENCILHGLRGVPYEGIIRVEARYGDTLKICIRDNGRGFDPEHPSEEQGSAASDHVGIRNVQERIRLHCGPEYGVRVESAPGKGTSVYLTLPVIRGERRKDDTSGHCGG